VPEQHPELVLKRDLAFACRILAANGQGDNIFGHVSARAAEADRFWMKPAALGLEEIGPDDLLLLDFDGNILEGSSKHPRHEEFPIHAEVFRARPEVMAVVHTHPKFSIAFAARGLELRPVSHEGSFFWPPGVGVFDRFTDLVRTREQGTQVAQALGSRRALFLRNHGIVVADASIHEVVWAALALERAAELQLLAQPTPSSPLLHTPEHEARQKQAIWYPARARAIFDYYVRKLG
jgi:ribulose-5-phosphate 4-epimerase/fuculose-1-phosphate aldolase